jgi:transcriptional regulator with XRE-family HTH domain
MIGPMGFKEKLHKLARAKGWEASDLARALGHPKMTTVHNWWAGRSKPDLKNAYDLSRVLGVSMEYLADDTQDDQPISRDDLSRIESVLLELARYVGPGVALQELSKLVEPTGRDPGRMGLPPGVNQAKQG